MLGSARQVVLLALLVASSTFTDARPLERRQNILSGLLGNLLGGLGGGAGNDAAGSQAGGAAGGAGGLGGIQCNLARLRIVGALGDTGDAIGQIQDAATQSAAQAGLDQANGGIQQIAQAILAGEAPPQGGRDEVEAGLTAIGTALAAGDAADPAIAETQEGLDASVEAGQDVVANC